MNPSTHADMHNLGFQVCTLGKPVEFDYMSKLWIYEKMPTWPKLWESFKNMREHEIFKQVEQEVFLRFDTQL